MSADIPERGCEAEMLAVEHVTYRYPGVAGPALDDVSFALAPGELCLLAGRSGHGKSTLLRAACGLVPHFHGGSFAGRVRLAGLDTREHGPATLGTLAGALFQDPETQLVMSSVRSELALAQESRGHSDAEIARGVEEIALALGVDALLDRATHELSGGEQQRVALGAALAGRPRLLLLDEPTSQLDPVAGDELISLLRRLNEEHDTAILLAEHRLERCLPSADRVIALQEGRVAYDGDPRAFLEWAGERDPALRTPSAKLFSLAGLGPPPVGVKQARAELRRRELLPAVPRSTGSDSRAAGADTHFADPAARVRAGSDKTPRVRGRARARGGVALELHGVWHEIPRGPAVLRGVDLRLSPGESVALMGRNGAGKSTLLRHAAGLLAPTRGRVASSGRVALLLQNPGDYFLHDRLDREASPRALARAGLQGLEDRNPRDLSGGQRQRLALAIVTDGTEEPAVLALDEPTRGMDREAKAELAADLRARAERGQAVIVATHDAEFACVCATRTVLLAEGRVIADGPAGELLAGGWYFATETARVLGGAGGALTPEQGAALLAGGAESAERVEPADERAGRPEGSVAPTGATDAGGGLPNARRGLEAVG